MSDSAAHAVFLSYAREDAPAARRIADALRGFGLEVWFDQSELRGGEAWDQKIRHQIKECVLFVPVISTHTEERGEGYFRLEWKLADERTGLMAKGVPFLVPVVVDGTGDADALVPDSFRAVQWMRLPGGVPTPEFVAQVKRLLEAPRKPAAGKRSGNASPDVIARPRSGFPRGPVVALAVMVLCFTAYVALRPVAKETPAAPLKPAAETKAAVPAPVVNDKSVAVLAFANLSDDKDNEYFSDGISEELLNALAKVPGLRVAARTSAFYFKGKNVPVPEIAQKLGVTYVVEGSVRKAGTNVRITAQLISAADGFHLWSETYTRELKDVFALQDEIARVVAQSLQLTLGTVSPVANAAINPEVYRLYLEGRHAWNLRGGTNNNRAEALFREALTLDPKFARAKIGLADVVLYRNGVITFNQRNNPVLSQIIAQAQAALSIEPNLGEAYVTIAEARKRSWQMVEAEQAFRRAIALNPNYPTAYHWFGLFLLERGLMDEALAEMKIAVQLDPLAPQILSNFGTTLGYAGRWEEGLVYLDRAATVRAEAGQNAAPITVNHMLLLAEAGRTNEAVQRARSMKVDPVVYSALYAFVFARAGMKMEAEGALGNFRSTSSRRFWWLALAALGRYDEILTTMDAGEFDNAAIESLLFHPDWDPIRKDPRFLKVISDLGLNEAHQRAQAWRAHHSQAPAKNN